MNVIEETHVYCIECREGKRLFDYLVEPKAPLPVRCQSCGSWNPEDSMSLEDRPNYRPIAK